MQATLAVVGAAAALLDGVFGTGGGVSIVSGLCSPSVIPFTLLVVFPINRQLEEPHRLGSDPGTLTLLQDLGPAPLGAHRPRPRRLPAADVLSRGRALPNPTPAPPPCR